MTTTVSGRSHQQQNRDYQQAMAHLHRGEWSEAIRLLQKLTRAHPHDARLRAALDDAKFRAHFDAESNVKPKRWIFPWRRYAALSMFLLGIILIVGLGRIVLLRGIQPLRQQHEVAQAQTLLLEEATAFLDAGQFDKASERLQTLLAQAPGQPEALAGLVHIDEERKLAFRYDRAVALQEAGNCEAALEAFGALSLEHSDYRDVNERVHLCRRSLEMDKLLAAADIYYRVGLTDKALSAYEQIHTLAPELETTLVIDRLVKLHLRQGRAALAEPPVEIDDVRQAMEHFGAALKLKPRDPEVNEEQKLAQSYITGRDAVARQEYERGVDALQVAYNIRPNYLDGALVEPLYTAYVGLGDSYQRAGDCALAYEYYRRASALPIADKTLANARLEQSAACLTPTPTPTNTPEPTVTPLPTATAPPTPTPLPLAGFHNRIVFKSDNPDRPGFWVMDPDGANREYVGSLDDVALRAQFDAQIEAHRYAPDGQRFVYVGKLDGRAQIFIHTPPHPTYGQIPDRPLTRLTGIAYDPVWAPDGSLVAFVTEENESDDIWVIRPDSSGQKALMRNPWQWDKHPTWSPDSTRIAFFSNREGTKQIFMMDASGQNVHNISNVPWDEYDPVWIR